MKFSVTTTRTYDIIGVLTGVITFSERYEEIRSKFKYKGCNCWICGRRFEYGEHISMLHIRAHGNRAVCHECAGNVKSHIENDTPMKKVIKNEM